MAKSTIVRPDLKDTYKEWQEAQDIPLIEGFFIEDVKEVAVKPWSLNEGLGALLQDTRDYLPMGWYSPLLRR